MDGEQLTEEAGFEAVVLPAVLVTALTDYVRQHHDNERNGTVPDFLKAVDDFLAVHPAQIIPQNWDHRVEPSAEEVKHGEV